MVSGSSLRLVPYFLSHLFMLSLVAQVLVALVRSVWNQGRSSIPWSCSHFLVVSLLLLGVLCCSLVMPLLVSSGWQYFVLAFELVAYLMRGLWLSQVARHHSLMVPEQTSEPLKKSRQLR